MKAPCAAKFTSANVRDYAYVVTKFVPRRWKAPAILKVERLELLNSTAVMARFGWLSAPELVLIRCLPKGMRSNIIGVLRKVPPAESGLERSWVMRTGSTQNSTVSNPALTFCRCGRSVRIPE